MVSCSDLVCISYYQRGSIILTFGQLHCLFPCLHKSEDLVLLDFLLLLNRTNLDENEFTGMFQYSASEMSLLKLGLIKLLKTNTLGHNNPIHSYRSFIVFTRYYSLRLKFSEYESCSKTCSYEKCLLLKLLNVVCTLLIQYIDCLSVT